MTIQKSIPENDEPPTPAFVLPDYRQFEVKRVCPEWPKRTDHVRPIETLQVTAHVVQYTGKGTTLLFSDYVWNPKMNIVEQRLTRIINGFVDLIEVPVTPSAFNIQ